MAYIEAHQSLRDHRKILQLASELDMPEAHVTGHCMYLWLWSVDNAPDGILPGSPRIIERAAGWEGESGKFVSAMVAVGLLHRLEDERLEIHDWFDYAGRLIEKRKENADRMREARSKKIEERSSNVQRTFNARSGATVPNSILKEKDNAHQGSQSSFKTEVRVTSRSDYTPEFEEFWENYPKRTEKAKAFKVWNTRLKAKDATAAQLIESAKIYAHDCHLNSTDVKFMKYPATFLGPDKPYEEYMDRSPPVDQGKRAIEATLAMMDEKGMFDPFA